MEETYVTPGHSLYILSHFSFSDGTPGFTGHIGAQQWAILPSFTGGLVTFGPMQCERRRGTQRLGHASLLGNVGRGVGSSILNLEMKATCGGGQRLDYLGTCASSWIRTICTQGHLLPWGLLRRRGVDFHLT